MPADDPWGINGPDFLLIYAILFAVVFVVGFILPRLAGPIPKATDDREPTAPEVALLTGGRVRVVFASIAALRAVGAIGAGERGELVATAARPMTGLSRVDYAVYDAAAGRMRTREVHEDPRVRAEVDAVEASAMAAGWYASGRRRRLVRLSGLLFIALGVLGLVRTAVGAVGGYPVGYLIAMTLAALVFGALLLAVPRVTAGGRRALLRVRGRHGHLAPRHAPAWSTYGSDSAAMGVALYGSSALMVHDPGFASDAGIQSDSGSSFGGDSGGGSGDSGGGSGCGGGSSCSSGSSCGGGSSN